MKQRFASLLKWLKRITEIRFVVKQMNLEPVEKVLMQCSKADPHPYELRGIAYMRQDGGTRKIWKTGTSWVATIDPEIKESFGETYDLAELVTNEQGTRKMLVLYSPEILEGVNQ